MTEKIHKRKSLVADSDFQMFIHSHMGKMEQKQELSYAALQMQA